MSSSVGPRKFYRCVCQGLRAQDKHLQIPRDQRTTLSASFTHTRGEKGTRNNWLPPMISGLLEISTFVSVTVIGHTHTHEHTLLYTSARSCTFPHIHRRPRVCLQPDTGNCLLFTSIHWLQNLNIPPIPAVLSWIGKVRVEPKHYITDLWAASQRSRPGSYHDMSYHSEDKDLGAQRQGDKDKRHGNLILSLFQTHLFNKTPGYLIFIYQILTSESLRRSLWKGGLVVLSWWGIYRESVTEWAPLALCAFGFGGTSPCKGIQRCYKQDSGGIQVNVFIRS